MIIQPKRKRYTADEVIKFGFVGGRYVCRCGSMIAVSPKVLGESQGTCLLLEGYYDIDEIDPRFVPDCLKTDEERGQ